ncbi:ABC transporter ATP-binding protein [Xanthobacteraceae bacterium Astr-EGSB]|uniref:ATP-binding cassette domain-containing protein n=1 Tax=Astrobacterium formosum TaxID=3069710 RepID=UPI0027B1D771|nr:ABC transporter ATP-binding protein [Xanthobacteraceae bacterium Astr-EGSB]
MTAEHDTTDTFTSLTRNVGTLGKILTPHHKRLLIGVSLWALCLSILEMAVAAAVVPFIDCLNDRCPAQMRAIADAAGWPTIPLIAFGLIVLILVKLATQAILAWASADLNQQVQRDTVGRLLWGYLHQSWSAFRQRHPTDYFRRCSTTAVDAAYVSYQCATLASSIILIVCMTGLMLWKWTALSLALIVGFAGISFLTQRLISSAQRRAARQRENALRVWNVEMSEAFAAFREVRVYGLERFFLDEIQRNLDEIAKAGRRLTVFPTLPRLLIDLSVVAIALLVVVIWTALAKPLSDLLPILVFYAIVARAIVPALINLGNTLAVLRGSFINIELISDEFRMSAAGYQARIGVAATPAEKPSFGLCRVTFRHAAEQPEVIADCTLTIPHPSWVAIVGPSGSGKSTLMELLCGILSPTAGRVIHAWPPDGGRAGPVVAYLPQHVALRDGTIAENVVFGFDAGDPDKIEEAIRLACFSDVAASMGGLGASSVGANGTRLSGGERQRLALARALYRRPDLLLLDEATSGLDESTEGRLLAELRRHRPEMTVVYVTHRASNLRFADRVLRMTDGQTVEADP